MMTGRVQILGVDQTIFFKTGGNGLVQRGQIQIINESEALPVSLMVEEDVKKEETNFGILSTGPHLLDFYVADKEQPRKIIFTLLSEGNLLDTKEIEWFPQKKWEVHLVHYSHHDYGYTDIPSNVIKEHIQFLDDVLDYCEETENWPDPAKFRWLVEQGYSLIEFAKSRPPDVVEKLMGFVRKGQIEITALFGNQTMEMSSHEELIRLLYPTVAFKRLYGVEITSAAHNDIPGFSWGLASVLAASGVKYFSPGLPSWYFNSVGGSVHALWDESEVQSFKAPGGFWWEGPDGKKVLLWYNYHGREWYPSGYDHAVKTLPEMIQVLKDEEYPYDEVMYTIRGGHRDNAPATMLIANIAKEWNETWVYPKLISSTYTRFLTKFEDKYGASLKTFRGDVPGTDYPVGAAGTPKDTAINRSAHEMLMSGERLASLTARWADFDYPKEKFDQAYQNVFYFDEHCWGMHQSGGPAMEGAWGEKRTHAYRAAALSHDVIQKASNQLVDHIHLEKDGYYLTVINPMSWKRDDVIRAPFHAWYGSGTPMHWRKPDNEDEDPILVSGTANGRSVVSLPLEYYSQPFDLVDVSTGQVVPHQLSRVSFPQAAQPYTAERFAIGQFDEGYLLDIIFTAKDLPAMGYKTFILVPKAEQPRRPDQGEVSSSSVENAFYKVVFNQAQGTITSLFDKTLNRELVDPQAEHSFAQLIVRSSKDGKEHPGQWMNLEVIENGPIFTLIRRNGTALGCPQWVQEITIYHEVKRIDINNRVLRDSTPMLELYFAFPFNMQNPEFRFEASDSVIRPTIDQLPGTNTDYYCVQHWVEVSDQGWGITWTPLDTHLAEFGGIWPGYVSGAHHGVTPPGYGHPFLESGDLQKGHIYALAMYNNFRTNFINVQPGEYLFRYSFTSHAGNFSSATPWKSGWNAIHPAVTAWKKGPQAGALDSEASFLQVDAANVALITLKHAEDGDGLICRLIEMQGKGTDGSVRLPNVSISEVIETNPIEENLKNLPHEENLIPFRIKPFEIKTIRIREK